LSLALWFELHRLLTLSNESITQCCVNALIGWGIKILSHHNTIILWSHYQEDAEAITVCFVFHNVRGVHNNFIQLTINYILGMQRYWQKPYSFLKLGLGRSLKFTFEHLPINYLKIRSFAVYNTSTQHSFILKFHLFKSSLKHLEKKKTIASVLNDAVDQWVYPYTTAMHSKSPTNG